MPIIVSYAIQLLLIIHVLKTGRDRYWIWMLLALPGIGGIAYLVVELIPEFTSGIRGQRAIRGIRKSLNPSADVKAARMAFEQSVNADSGRRYAEALIDVDDYQQALTILSQVRRGLHETDPVLLELKATAEFHLKQYSDAVETLELLQEHNPDHSSPDGHLLYARSLEALGQREKALENYQTVSSYYPGAEARYRYCKALMDSGDREAANSAIADLLRDARLAPRHFQKSQAEWLRKARQLQSLSAQE